MKANNDGMLVGAGILVFVADDYRKPARHGGSDHRVRREQLGHLLGGGAVSVASFPPSPSPYVGRQAESFVVGTGNLSDQAINSTDFHATIKAARSRGKDVACRIGVGQIGRASCWERVCQYVENLGVDVYLQKKKKRKR